MPGSRIGLTALFGVTMAWGIASRDSLFWKQELVASFFRPEGFAFEPTARRHAVAACGFRGSSIGARAR